MTVQDHPDAAGPNPGTPAAAAPAPGDREVGEAELAAFYEANVARLTTYLTRMAGRDDAQELAADAFEKFFLWWPDNPDHPEPRAALFWIAKCRLRDHRRRSGREVTADAAELEQFLIAGGHVTSFPAVELRVDLKRALSELSERQRQALEWRYVADLPVKDCAAALGTGIDNTKKILKRALATLRTSPRMDSYASAGQTEEMH